MMKVVVAGTDYMGVRSGVEKHLSESGEFEVLSFPNSWQGPESRVENFDACLFTGPHDTFHVSGSRDPARWLLDNVVRPDRRLVLPTTISDEFLGKIPGPINYSSRHVDFWKVWDAMHEATSVSSDGLVQLRKALALDPPETRFKFYPK